MKLTSNTFYLTYYYNKTASDKQLYFPTVLVIVSLIK